MCCSQLADIALIDRRSAVQELARGCLPAGVSSRTHAQAHGSGHVVAALQSVLFPGVDASG